MKGAPMRPLSIFPPCALCGGRLTANERHWYGTLCEGCAHKESDAYDAARGHPRCTCLDDTKLAQSPRARKPSR